MGSEKLFSERIKHRFEELGVGHIDGAEEMTDDELNAAAVDLHLTIHAWKAAGNAVLPPEAMLEWRDNMIAAGIPVNWPPEVLAEFEAINLAKPEIYRYVRK